MEYTSVSVCTQWSNVFCCKSWSVTLWILIAVTVNTFINRWWWKNRRWSLSNMTTIWSLSNLQWLYLHQGKLKWWENVCQWKFLFKTNNTISICQWKSNSQPRGSSLRLISNILSPLINLRALDLVFSLFGMLGSASLQAYNERSFRCRPACK